MSVYLDGTHSAWQSVGTMTQRLLEANVQQAQGFFLNVSNYQPDSEPHRLRHLDLRLHRDGDRPLERLLRQPRWLREPVLPGHPVGLQHLGPDHALYTANMGNAVATTHFVIDTSRNGDGPNNMSAFANRALQPAGQRDRHARER